MGRGTTAWRRWRGCTGAGRRRPTPPPVVRAREQHRLHGHVRFVGGLRIHELRARGHAARPPRQPVAARELPDHEVHQADLGGAGHRGAALHVHGGEELPVDHRRPGTHELRERDVRERLRVELGHGGGGARRNVKDPSLAVLDARVGIECDGLCRAVSSDAQPVRRLVPELNVVGGEFSQSSPSLSLVWDERGYRLTPPETCRLGREQHLRLPRRSGHSVDAGHDYPVSLTGLGEMNEASEATEEAFRCAPDHGVLHRLTPPAIGAVRFREADY